MLAVVREVIWQCALWRGGGGGGKVERGRTQVNKLSAMENGRESVTRRRFLGRNRLW